MVAFAGRLPIDEDILRSNGSIAWAARNSSKPSRASRETWVIQASAAWSQVHLEEEADAITNAMLAEFAELAGKAIPKPELATAHRWRFARAEGGGNGSSWNTEIQLGVCGDWTTGPRVECAWMSGDTLANRILDGAK